MKTLSGCVWVLAFLFWVDGLYAQNIESAIEQSGITEAFWSVTVRNAEGEILESYQSEKLIIPASNQKLITTAAILDKLGSDYTYETVIYGRGGLSGTTWQGDVIIKGSGDPSISGDLYEDDRYHVFHSLESQLREAGIDSISGDLVADISLFDRQYYPKGWDWYDFSFYYGVQISPLSFNNNAVDLDVFADGAIGETPRITWFPDSTDYVDFENKQVITHPGIEYDEYYRRGLGENDIVLGSTLPKGYHEEESLSIENPAMFFLDSFKHYLTEQGVGVGGKLMIPSGELAQDSLHVLARHQSKTLAELLKWANKESDNFYVEMMLKTLSAQESEEPGSFEDGIKRVRSFLAAKGIDTTYVIMNDGSGMAAGNFTQTAIISEVLYFMQDHPDFSTYYNSMAVAGIDGTLAHRMKGTPLYNNFRGKTGFVSAVRTLSGYMNAKSGSRIIVSIATNNFAGKVKPVDAVHETILNHLYQSY